MSAPLALSLFLTVLALALSLGLLVLALLWQHWRTATGCTLLQYVLSLMLVQSSGVITQISILAGSPTLLSRIFVNLGLLSFYLLILATLALVLQAAQAMRALGQLTSRTGIAGLVLLQPAIWQYDVLRLPSPLDHDVFGSPYTSLGRVLAIVCAGLIAIALAIGWHFRRHRGVRPLILPIALVALSQLAALAFADVRQILPTGIVGGLACALMSRHVALRFELRPRSPQLHWLRALSNSAAETRSTAAQPQALLHLCEQIRRLIDTDVVLVFATMGPDRLSVIVSAGAVPQAQGRQISSGEGLAGRVMQTLQAMRVPDDRASDGRAPQFADLPLYASMSVPLIYRDRLIGVLNAHEVRPGRTFSDHDQALLEMVAPQATLLLALQEVGRADARQDDSAPGQTP